MKVFSHRFFLKFCFHKATQKRPRKTLLAIQKLLSPFSIIKRKFFICKGFQLQICLCFMRLFVSRSVACWSKLDYGPLILAWMLLYATFQLTILKSQTVII